MKQPLFLRRWQWKQAYKQAAKKPAMGEPGSGKWLVLLDARDPWQQAVAEILIKKRPAGSLWVVAYEGNWEHPQQINLAFTELTPDLQAPTEVRDQVLQHAYDFVLQLAPNPEPPLALLAVEAHCFQRIAINPAKSSELYRLEFQWTGLSSEEAVPELFNQLKALFSHVVSA